MAAGVSVDHMAPADADAGGELKRALAVGAGQTSQKIALKLK